MEIPVLIEPVAENGFRATDGQPFGLEAEGATADEALYRLQEKIAERLRAGAQVTSITVPAENPWLRLAGTLKDDPLLEEWKRAIAERRKEIDEDPDIP